MCVMKMPAGPAEPIVGIAGQAAWPVNPQLQPQAELALLRGQARRIVALLRTIHWRIERLQALRPQEPSGV
jgi:hypothetical protein